MEESEQRLTSLQGRFFDQPVSLGTGEQWLMKARVWNDGSKSF